VLQGSDNVEAETWYQAVKDLPFEGWAMGGNNMRDVELLLRRLIVMRDEKKLDPGKDLIHFLGTSRLEWAMMLYCGTTQSSQACESRCHCYV